MSDQNTKLLLLKYLLLLHRASDLHDQLSQCTQRVPDCSGAQYECAQIRRHDLSTALPSPHTAGARRGHAGPSVAGSAGIWGWHWRVSPRVHALEHALQATPAD